MPHRGRRHVGEEVRRVPSFREQGIPDDEFVKYVIGGEEHDFPTGGKTAVRWTPTGIFLVRVLENGSESLTKVVDGCVKPLARLLVDDEVYHRWSIDGREVTAKLDELLKQLTGEGAVLSRRNAQDVLSIVARGMVQTTEKRYATYGVYPEDDKLVLCEDPLPIKDEQAAKWEQVRAHVGHEATREEVQAYVDMLGYWHPYEVLPALGIAFAAPFTPTLRQAQILVPYLFHYAHLHDLGKSRVALIASQKL